MIEPLEGYDSRLKTFSPKTYFEELFALSYKFIIFAFQVYAEFNSYAILQNSKVTHESKWPLESLFFGSRNVASFVFRLRLVKDKDCDPRSHGQNLLNPSHFWMESLAGRLSRVQAGRPLQFARHFYCFLWYLSSCSLLCLRINCCYFSSRSFFSPFASLLPTSVIDSPF